jgi:hypothetical protein
MLLEPELHHLRSVPDHAEVSIDAAHHLLGAVPKLPGDGVDAHRCPVIQRLEPGRSKRVAEHPRAQLARLPAGAHRHRSITFRTSTSIASCPVAKDGEEELARTLQPRAEDVGSTDLRELGDERNDAPGSASLEPPVRVRPKGDVRRSKLTSSTAEGPVSSLPP